ncbi:hypothetical protein EYF80_021528 [Liparis tanakae]|uniref:Uncharacterized protein n=1 Tax=Liparis tanakae TaxID=230148 RepID=A0A4Z2HQT4_9TELE|nr:hypothetical protein EYF80_021528 [Liparis tanakae]
MEVERRSGRGISSAMASDPAREDSRFPLSASRDRRELRPEAIELPFRGFCLSRCPAGIGARAPGARSRGSASAPRAEPSSVAPRRGSALEQGLWSCPMGGRQVRIERSCVRV